MSFQSIDFLSDYSLETFFSWDNIQNGLLPNELDILRYLDAVGISKFLQEQPCLRDVYPFAKREPYWTNCKLYAKLLLFLLSLISKLRDIVKIIYWRLYHKQPLYYFKRPVSS